MTRLVPQRRNKRAVFGACVLCVDVVGPASADGPTPPIRRCAFAGGGPAGVHGIGAVMGVTGEQGEGEQVQCSSLENSRVHSLLMSLGSPTTGRECFSQPAPRRQRPTGASGKSAVSMRKNARQRFERVFLTRGFAARVRA